MTGDRYEPLPPITRLPSLAWSRMGTVARALVVLAALAAVAVIVMLAPRISETKRDNAARDRREAAEARERRITELRELMRPRIGVTATPAAPLADIERLITADARTRPDSRRVLRTDCARIRGGGSRYSCTAVSSDLPGGEVSRGGSVGHPYRAWVQGRKVTWCRVAGRPGEGSNKGRLLVPIPTACGG